VSPVVQDAIVSLCWHLCFQPVSVERASQLAMVQELVSLGHGISMIPDMARRVDQSERRVYRSITGKKSTRTVAVVSNS
jgi:LysR family hydrogen peroxide-inducible transcriptional activator